MPKTKIAEITPDNVDEYGLCYVKNIKNIGFTTKKPWLVKQLEKDNLKIKVITPEDETKTIAHIEYAPGESTWRAIDAKDYMVIHCLVSWDKKLRSKGFAKQLIDEVEKDAATQGAQGVVAVSSEKSFFTNRKVFLKNGFEKVDSHGNFDLLVKKFKNAPDPKFNDYEKSAKKYKGMNVIYSNQCVMNGKSISDIRKLAKKNKLDVKFIELKTPKEAQKAPTPNAVFQVVNDGEVLSDRYISGTRFMNIVKSLK
jgi:predicted N-acetyltransferase YhbS